MTVRLVLSALAIATAASPVVCGDDATPVECPLVTRTPAQRVLLIVKDGEGQPALEACRASRMAAELGRFGDERDLAQYHLIVVGSNQMDYWGDEPARKAPEAFAPLEEFVRNGGHLLVFNTYNGRNMQHLERFGVRTGFNHNGRYQAVPGKTDVLFAGSESLVPEGDNLKSSGNFTVTTPHVVLLARGPGSRAGEPSVATIPTGRGRVTYTGVEPSFGNPNGLWLMRVLIHWAARGGPVTPGPTDPIVTDRRPPIPTNAELAKAAAQLRESFGADPDVAELKGWAERAAVYTSAAGDEQDAALRYQLSKQAAEAFARSGEAEEAVAALDRWTSGFAVPRHEAALSILQTLEKSAPPSDWQAQVRALGLAAMEEAVQARDIPTARALLEVATRAAEASKNRRLMVLCQAESKYVDRVAQAAEGVQPWFDRLKSQPDDAEAARRAGMFQTCVLRDWQRGLTWLAQGDDPLLRKAAELERPAMQQRAAHWYSLALLDLTGLRRTSVALKLQRVGGPAFSLRIVVSRAPGTLRLELTPGQIVCQSDSNTALPERITLGDLA